MAAFFFCLSNLGFWVGWSVQQNKGSEVKLKTFAHYCTVWFLFDLKSENDKS